MGRKNKRKKSAYYRKLRINPKMNPKRLVSKGTQPERETAAGEHTDSTEQACARTPQRGEIWFAEFGTHPGTSVQEGCRPALVISNDTANQHSEIITVVPMTTRIKKTHLPTHVMITSHDVMLEQGQYMERSMLLAEQVTTIGKDSLIRYVGMLREDKLKEVEAAVLVQMNITTIPATPATFIASAASVASAVPIERSIETEVLHQSKEMVSYGS